MMSTDRLTSRPGPVRLAPAVPGSGHAVPGSGHAVPGSGAAVLQRAGEQATPVALVAHGSQDPRAAAATRALARAVAAARPGLDVRACFLDHRGPRPAQVLGALQAAGHIRATVVPLLLTAAFHTRVDIPDVLARARAGGLRLAVAVGDVLGPVGGVVDPWLLAGLRRRLGGLELAYDAVVLAAAGTRDPDARATVEQAAAALGALLDLPCAAAYASAAPPAAGQAVARFRRAGARRVAVAAYFLAPGRLYAQAARSALEAGAAGVAAPLGASRELATLVLSRADAALPADQGLPAPFPADQGQKHVL